MCAVCDTCIYTHTQRHSIITDKFWFLSIFVKRGKPEQCLLDLFFSKIAFRFPFQHNHTGVLR